MSGVKLRCEYTEKKDLNERGFAMTKAIFQDTETTSTAIRKRFLEGGLHFLIENKFYRKWKEVKVQKQKSKVQIQRRTEFLSLN